MAKTTYELKRNCTLEIGKEVLRGRGATIELTDKQAKDLGAVIGAYLEEVKDAEVRDDGPTTDGE